MLMIPNTPAASVSIRTAWAHTTVSAATGDQFAPSQNKYGMRQPTSVGAEYLKPAVSPTGFSGKRDARHR